MYLRKSAEETLRLCRNEELFEGVSVSVGASVSVGVI